MEKKILVITSCSKNKLKHPAKACELYKGQFFHDVLKFSRLMNFDLNILSAKYGLITSDKIISPYNEKIHTKEQKIFLQQKISKKFLLLLEKYDKIILLMGKNYIEVFDQFINHPKIITAIDHRGSGGFLQLVSKLKKTKKENFLKMIESNLISFSIDDIINLGGKPCHF